MFHSKKTWFILSLLAFICAFGAYKIFPQTFPILNINLDMSREEAISNSKNISKKFKIGPDSSFWASTFGVDGYAQNFIELDAGGTSEFIKILDNKYYEAYTWKVRQYKPNDVNEAWYSFTPEGNVYGFYEKLSDDLFIKSLSREDANNLAEKQSIENWNIDLKNYDLVETKEDLKISNRLDYTFVYKRNDIFLANEGEYRLRLSVSGDKLTEVRHFIKIPESFNRKYEEMRSSNNTIASLATYGMFIFYVLGGIIVGMFILNREKYLLWKTAIFWALFVAIVTLLSGLNYMPLIWLNYDTAISTQNFILQNSVMSLLSAIVDFIFILLSFVAAESLTRKAFPDHIQFWKLWNTTNASSHEVIGRTVGGYLLIALDLIFVVVFYMITANYLGWWVPSSTLFAPDMIATPFPWLSAVGMSLHAGFWEECLFRAVPIAGAVLISNKYGNRTAWIIFALILQAVIFAGAHANYPSYPPYSRLVELIIPSLFWGIIYIKFGLLPVIISHFGYDVVWFSLPLFTSSSSNLFFDKTMVIILTLVPVWVILRSIYKNKSVSNIDKKYLNLSFKPKEIPQKNKTEVKKIKISISKKYKFTLFILFIISILAFSLRNNFKYGNSQLKITRLQALELAEKYIDDIGIDLDDSWTVLTQFNSGSLNLEDKYVWQEIGEDVYDKLIGRYLQSTNWNIRYVKFSGDQQEKTEEYSVILNNDGTLNQVRHKIPENRLLPTLNEDEARKLARKYIFNKFYLNVSEVEELSFQPSELPNRTDWLFTFKDINNSFEGSESRISVNIAGDKVSAHSTYFYTPEEWSRNEQNKSSSYSILNMICNVILIFLIIFAAVSSLINWNRGVFNIDLFKRIFIFLLFLNLMSVINSIPNVISTFSTAQPYYNQISTSLISSFLMIFVSSLAISLIFTSMSSSNVETFHRFSFIEIILISLTVIGFFSQVFYLDNLKPIWFDGFEGINTYFPLFQYLASQILSYISIVIIILFFVNYLSFTIKYNKAKRLITTLSFFIIISLVFIGSNLSGNIGINSYASWIKSSLILSLTLTFLYNNYLIYNYKIIPILVALIGIFTSIGNSSSQMYPGIFLTNIIGSLCLLLISLLIYSYLIKIGED